MIVSKRRLAPALAVILALACSVPAGAAILPSEKVPWHQDGDFASVLAKAKKEKKLVLIDFYATWCGPCKMMDRQTYSDSLVGLAAAKFVPRKIDGEKGEGIALSERYKITGYPTVIVVDATGKEVTRKSGFYQPAQFRRFLDDTSAGRTNVAAIEAMIAGGKDTYDNRLALGEKAVEVGEWDKARAQVDKALTFEPKNADGRVGQLLLMLASAQRAAGAHQGAIADYRRYLAEFPGTASEQDAKTGLAVCLAETGQGEEAFATLKEVADAKPNDANLQGALARFSAALKVRLDEGLAAGLRAVELTNGAHTAYDALAEVYAARGQWDDAVLAAEKAVEKRPQDNYLRGRLEKFQEGAVAARNAPKQP